MLARESDESSDPELRVTGTSVKNFGRRLDVCVYVRDNFRQQILAQCAADAAVGKFHKLFILMPQFGIPSFDEGVVHVHFAHVVHDDSHLQVVTIRQNVLQQSCFSSTQESWKSCTVS